MLGLVLLYVGIVLISNGIYQLENIKDKSIVVLNYFVGILSIMVNLGVIIYAIMTKKDYMWFYKSATGLLFGFTYLYIAINETFNLDKRLYGVYSLFVAINTIPASILSYFHFAGDYRLSIIWILWGLLWLSSFLEINLGIKISRFSAKLAVFEGIFTAWIPGFLMLIGKW